MSMRCSVKLNAIPHREFNASPFTDHGLNRGVSFQLAIHNLRKLEAYATHVLNRSITFARVQFRRHIDNSIADCTVASFALREDRIGNISPIIAFQPLDCSLTFRDHFTLTLMSHYSRPG